MVVLPTPPFWLATAMICGFNDFTSFLIGCCVCACGKEDSITSETLEKDTEEVSSTEETKSAEEEATEQWEKGYNLPVDEQEAVEAENDCIEMMERISDIYGDAD